MTPEQRAQLDRKRAANRRLLSIPDRLARLDSYEVEGSPLGAEAQNRVVAAMRALSTGEQQPVTMLQMADAIRDLSTHAHIFLLPYDVEAEPGFFAGRIALAKAIAQQPDFFDPDGIVVLDLKHAGGLIVEFDDRRGAELRPLLKPGD
jgi:hypothetical protein